MATSNNATGRENMWNPQIWGDIDKAVMADVGRVRVAQKVFPAQQKPNQDNVQADILMVGQAPGDAADDSGGHHPAIP